MTFRFLLVRMLHSCVVLIGVSIVAFLLVRVMPGDPALIMLPVGTPRDVVAEMRNALGLNRPLYVQYAIFIRNAVRGDFGTSTSFRQPSAVVVAARIPATLELAGAAFLVSVAVSIPLGVLSAVKHDTAVDRMVRGLVMFGQSIPTFWLGIVFILLFAVWLRILPTSGRGSPAHLILPGISLGAYYVALLTRLVRAGMLEVLGTPYVRTARSKGLSEGRVVYVHALRNAMIPVLTLVGLQVGTLLGGAVITETVFAWPGLGSLVIAAIQTRDYPVIETTVLFSALVFLVINLALDVIYPAVDPRVRYG